MKTPLVAAGANGAVTPAGTPDTERVMVDLKPLCGVMVTLSEPVLPASTLTEVTLAARVKLALGITRETLAFDVNPPPVAVIVSG